LKTSILAPPLKAQKIFERFRLQLTTDQEKAGAILAFTFCYELSWKILKKVLHKKGIQAGSPRDTFRFATQNSLLDNVETWFEFVQKRNLTTHTYQELVVQELIAVFPSFSNALNKLIERLETTT